MAKKVTAPQTRKSKISGHRYAKRVNGRVITRSPRTAASDRVAVRAGRVTIAGARDAVEDYLDAQEIDRRLADPANRDRIPWDELKARRGLQSRDPAVPDRGIAGCREGSRPAQSAH